MLTEDYISPSPEEITSDGEELVREDLEGKPEAKEEANSFDTGYQGDSGPAALSTDSEEEHAARKGLKAAF